MLSGKWRGALESADRWRGGTGSLHLLFFLGGFKPLGFDDVLGRGVVDTQAICGFLNCHLVLIDHGDQLASLRGFNGVVAPLALGEGRCGLRQVLRLLSGRGRLGLTFAAGGSRHFRGVELFGPVLGEDNFLFLFFVLVNLLNHDLSALMGHLE